MIPDSVTVYLRNINAPYPIVDSAKGLLETAGKGTFYFDNPSIGILYYIVVKHRNSIETWSSAGNNFVNDELTYNFTTSSTQTFGNNLVQVDNNPIRFAFYSGDVTQDGIVDGNDASIVDNATFNLVTGYVNTDVNGDEVVDGSDAAIVDNNVLNFVSKITP